MELTKKQLKQLISEEVEKLSNTPDSYETLVESYALGYDGNEEMVPKQALIDLLEVLDESTIPREAFDAFMENLNEDKVAPLLKEVVIEEE